MQRNIPQPQKGVPMKLLLMIALMSLSANFALAGNCRNNVKDLAYTIKKTNNTNMSVSTLLESAQEEDGEVYYSVYFQEDLELTIVLDSKSCDVKTLSIGEVSHDPAPKEKKVE